MQDLLYDALNFFYLLVHLEVNLVNVVVDLKQFDFKMNLSLLRKVEAILETRHQLFLLYHQIWNLWRFMTQISLAQVKSQDNFFMLRFFYHTIKNFLLLELQFFISDSAFGKLVVKRLHLTSHPFNFRILFSSHILNIGYLFFQVLNFRNHWTELVMKFGD